MLCQFQIVRYQVVLQILLWYNLPVVHYYFLLCRWFILALSWEKVGLYIYFLINSFQFLIKFKYLFWEGHKSLKNLQLSLSKILWNILAFSECMNKYEVFSLLKFIYSEKATKFCEIFPLLLTNNLFFCVSRPILNFQ